MQSIEGVAFASVEMEVDGSVESGVGVVTRAAVVSDRLRDHGGIGHRD